MAVLANQFPLPSWSQYGVGFSNPQTVHFQEVPILRLLRGGSQRLCRPCADPLPLSHLLEAPGHTLGLMIPQDAWSICTFQKR